MTTNVWLTQVGSQHRSFCFVTISVVFFRAVLCYCGLRIQLFADPNCTTWWHCLHRHAVIHWFSPQSREIHYLSMNIFWRKTILLPSADCTMGKHVNNGRVNCETRVCTASGGFSQ